MIRRNLKFVVVLFFLVFLQSCDGVGDAVEDFTTEMTYLLKGRTNQGDAKDGVVADAQSAKSSSQGDDDEGFIVSAKAGGEDEILVSTSPSVGGEKQFFGSLNSTKNNPTQESPSLNHGKNLNTPSSHYASQEGSQENEDNRVLSDASVQQQDTPKKFDTPTRSKGVAASKIQSEDVRRYLLSRNYRKASLAEVSPQDVKNQYYRAIGTFNWAKAQSSAKERIKIAKMAQKRFQVMATDPRMGTLRLRAVMWLGITNYTFFLKDTPTEELVKPFNYILTNYGSTRYANDAHFYSALIYYKKGEINRAQNSLAKLSNYDQNDLIYDSDYSRWAKNGTVAEYYSKTLNIRLNENILMNTAPTAVAARKRELENLAQSVQAPTVAESGVTTGAVDNVASPSPEVATPQKNGVVVEAKDSGVKKVSQKEDAPTLRIAESTPSKKGTVGKGKLGTGKKKPEFVEMTEDEVMNSILNDGENLNSLGIDKNDEKELESADKKAVAAGEASEIGASKTPYKAPTSKVASPKKKAPEARKESHDGLAPASQTTDRHSVDNPPDDLSSDNFTNAPVQAAESATGDSSGDEGVSTSKTSDSKTETDVPDNP